MTVQELIEELQKYSPNTEVVLKELLPFPCVKGMPKIEPQIVIREKLVGIMRYSELDYKNEELTEYACLDFCDIKEWEEMERMCSKGSK